MQLIDGRYQVSASDLVAHVGCQRLTELNRAVADRRLKKPPAYSDPVLDALIERGQLHEAAYVEHLRGEGLNIVDLNRPDEIGATDQAVAATLDAMRLGADVIVQAALKSGAWAGRPDILRRVERPSRLGGHSYEAIDTKLSRETKTGAVLQLSLYSEMLAQAQGVAPEFITVVAPGEPFAEDQLRVDDYAAYYRRVKGELEKALARSPLEIYPEPVPQCEICRWVKVCDAQRRADDHPSFVAGLARSHVVELADHDLTTLEAFAAAPLPFNWKPARGAVETYERLREQARVQFKGRASGKPVFEVLDLAPELGLARLPEPSPGDIFLDLEGDGFVPPAGREYLFGYVYRNDDKSLVYRGDWAFTAEQEKTAFEAFIDFAAARLLTYPDLHIYHYAPYEPSAFKRLMGRYATREMELDGLLRSERFVDLYNVVRHGVRCSVESYSIKKLEIFYGFERNAALPDVNRSIPRVQAAMELGQNLEALQGDLGVVLAYNEDDCRSTVALRNWLESLRAAEIARGRTIERPTVKPSEASPALSDRDQRAAELAAWLSAHVPPDPEDRTVEQQGRWLLAQSLHWHRREDKANWWEFFRLRDLSPDDLIDERAGLSGLVFDGVAAPGIAPVHRYRFPAQECDLRAGDGLCCAGGANLGSVANVRYDEGVIEIKKQKKTADLHPDAIFEHKSISTDVLSDALYRIASSVVNHGLSQGDYPAARALLTRTSPSPGDGSLMLAGETTIAAAVRLAVGTVGGVLPIQGPPGTGKTHTAAQMICALVNAGKTVGITANSHAVIINLMKKTLELGKRDSVALACVHKGDKTDDAPSELSFKSDNARVLNAIGASANVIGGTAWFWATEAARNKVDVLFVDEAAQMSLANVLAVSHAAPTLVLLGDPQQLEQPTKASHPDGVDVSALDHILDGAQTIPADRGLFLAETWRLCPSICDFTSELFYEGRLLPRADRERQLLKSSGRLQGAGLRYFPVPHVGNTNVAREEVVAIGGLVDDILRSNSLWVDSDRVEHRVTLQDILIVAPYNAQVFALRQRLPEARIGTVDKFQGQEAPVVIYSMTTSSGAEAPRGLEFLFSLNRLNVASSRARCLCVLVAAPALFDVECKSPRQMQLANALCRYRELAAEI